MKNQKYSRLFRPIDLIFPEINDKIKVHWGCSILLRTMRKSGLGSNALERSGDMNNLEIPVGTSDFAEIRQNGYYYVDKTVLISELLKTASNKVTLITRPRRFGKSLGMSMLENFLISERIAELFCRSGNFPKQGFV